MKGNFKFKKVLTLVLVAAMLVGAMPINLFAEVNVNHKDIAGDKAKFVNGLKPVQIVKPAAGEKSADLIKNPDLPAVYTLRRDYKAEKGEKYEVVYQPYIASVGEGATPEEKAKINKLIKLPDLAGYEKPQESFTNSYDEIIKEAKKGHKTSDNGDKYFALSEFKYAAVENNVVVKHVFQDMIDFNKYTNPDGTITKNDGKTGTFIAKDGTTTTYDLSDETKKEEYNKLAHDHEELRTLKGNTGSTLEVQPLEEKDRKGFVPQIDKLKTQVPEDTSDFRIEYRYNRAQYDIIFDTQGGTPLQSRTYYFDQEIPKIDEQSIPTKKGSEFLGWKPSHDLKGEDGRTYTKGEIIKDANGNAIVDLGNIYYKRDAQNKLVLENRAPKKEKNQKDIQLKVPAMKLGDGKTIPREKLTFTAVWKDKEKSSYAVQFWVEKADHDENASLLEKYDFIAARVYKNKDTGTRPELSKESISGLPFPDLDQARLNKIWQGPLTADGYTGSRTGDAWFNRQEHLFLNKFYVYNKNLTDEQNKDPKQPTIVKDVKSTDDTVYNIYFDRQVYDLYFTESNARSEDETFYPSIYKPDGNGGAKLVGGPGDPYHFKARFNDLMLKWPNDAMQTKGFTTGMQSYGWGVNYVIANWPEHLDTPPYRLNADQFLDRPEYEKWGGFAKKIDKGNGTYITVDPKDFTTLSLGIKQGENSVPHHMDLWMDGFKDGETIIRYDLYRSKADTDSLTYGHKYPKVQGFTAKGNSKRTTFLTQDDIDDKNDERDETTAFPDKKYTDMFGFKHIVGQIVFMGAFFSNADSYGDPLDGNYFEKNGYLQFNYTRNKFPLRFNYDPSKIKGDNEFSYPIKGGTEDQNNNANALETFYEFPLKVLSPDLVEDATPQKDREYFKENPANFLDDANNLYKLGLYDLLQRDKADPSKFYKDKDGSYKVKRPENLSEQMVFKGWALDPAGTKLIREIKGEKMPNHALNLYAKWGEPDYKWKVTIDPNGGMLPNIAPDKLTTDKRTVDEGDVDKSKKETYPIKEDNDGNKQVFTVIQRQKLKELPKPSRYGYDFLGWEIIHYKKDQQGNFTDEHDTAYRTKYKVPELYSFGTDVVAPIYLKAIWVENKRVDIKVEHYFLTSDLKPDTSVYPNPEKNTLKYKRVGDYVPTTAERQDEKWILANHQELVDKLSGTIKDEDGIEHDLKAEYEAYNNRVKLNNTFFQTFRALEDLVDQAKSTPDNTVYKANPDNVFKFFYRPFRKREYKVNYIDERGKAEIEKFFTGLNLDSIEGLSGDELLAKNTANKAKYEAKKADLEKILDNYRIINEEEVSNGNRHYDARNYRAIPGWKLASKPQQQLFFDVDEETNDFLGINGTGSDKIFFYYKDVRVIETKKDDTTPEGYVRVTFKIDDEHKGGVFKDKDGKEATELYYDVIKGLKSDNLPHPVIWEDGKKDSEGKLIEKEANRYYITPNQGKSFKGWDNEKWLNKETEISRDYTFTAYFDWSGLTSSGLVRTEAYKDPNGKWTNDFAPTIDQLKKQLVWMEKGAEKPIPTGVKIEFVYKDKGGTEKALKTDEDVYNLVKEMNIADAKETVRVVNIVAKVTFEEGKAPQELSIPITVYKNRYEALTGTAKPLFLSEAEKKEAKDGGLNDILKNNTENRYIKVTVNPTEKIKNKDAKVYYVNPNAWVGIPELTWTDAEKAKYSFLKWSADKDNQNEGVKQGGIFDFNKRHKFTEDTVITPIFSDEAVEQTDPNTKPDVPETYVKVIVKTTDKATDETKFEKTFWVNPTKEVTIGVTNPEGKKNQEVEITGLGKKKVNYIFKEWQKVQTGEADDSLTKVNPAVKIDLAKNQYTDKVTVIEAAYKKSIVIGKIEEPLKTDTLDTPKGKEITDDMIKEKITPQAGKIIQSVRVISKPDGNTVGETNATVVVTYTDGTTQGTDNEPIKVPVKVHEPVVKANPDGSKPKEAMKNYVKITFKAGTGGTVSGDLVYYVSPEVEVDMTSQAAAITKVAGTGYTSNGGTWTNTNNKTLKGTFTDQETVFVFNFVKSEDIVEKTDENTVKPEGYVTVTFKTDGHGQVNNKSEVVYFVNPDANIKLKVLAQGEQAQAKQLVVPTPAANDNYKFKEWQESIDETTEIKSDRTHVAIFEAVAKKVTLTYNKGGDDVTGTVPNAVSVNAGDTVGLAEKGSLEKANHIFLGWKLEGDETIYKEKEAIVLNENKTATAQWQIVKHTVEFDTLGGTPEPAAQTVDHGSKATKPTTDPTKENFVFEGWKKESENDFFDFNKPIIENIKLLAQWTSEVQKIGENDTVGEGFIKVTFEEGEHGKLYIDGAEKTSPITYKVAKNLSLEDAKEKGLVVPEIKANKYYKVKNENNGWDKELDLTLAAGETEKIFTAQYEPQGDVIPVDPSKTAEDIQREKPAGMVLVEFKVPEDKAFMLGNTKFYVKKDEVVNIPTPRVHKLELPNGAYNDYVFRGWDLTKLNNEWKFSSDTTLRDGAKEKPTISVRIPSANAKNVVITNMTDGATGYLRVTRGTAEPVVIESTKRGRRNIFSLATLEGSALNEGDLVEVYAKKDGVESDLREFIVSK